jgi:hypothetical protein
MLVAPFFLSLITAFHISPGLHKGSSSYRRSLQPSKENIQHFKTWNLFIFCIFVRLFCPSGSGSAFSQCVPGSGSSGPKSMRIRIRIWFQIYIFFNPDPDLVPGFWWSKTIIVQLKKGYFSKFETFFFFHFCGSFCLQDPNPWKMVTYPYLINFTLTLLGLQYRRVPNSAAPPPVRAHTWGPLTKTCLLTVFPKNKSLGRRLDFQAYLSPSRGQCVLCGGGGERGDNFTAARYLHIYCQLSRDKTVQKSPHKINNK